MKQNFDVSTRLTFNQRASTYFRMKIMEESYWSYSTAGEFFNGLDKTSMKAIVYILLRASTYTEGNFTVAHFVSGYQRFEVGARAHNPSFPGPIPQEQMDWMQNLATEFRGILNEDGLLPLRVGSHPHLYLPILYGMLCEINLHNGIAEEFGIWNAVKAYSLLPQSKLDAKFITLTTTGLLGIVNKSMNRAVNAEAFINGQVVHPRVLWGWVFNLKKIMTKTQLDAIATDPLCKQFEHCMRTNGNEGHFVCSRPKTEEEIRATPKYQANKSCSSSSSSLS
jgi:hypothetical protein